jgi:hypothetical protein
MGNLLGSLIDAVTKMLGPLDTVLVLALVFFGYAIYLLWKQNNDLDRKFYAMSMKLLTIIENNTRILTKLTERIHSGKSHSEDD